MQTIFVNKKKKKKKKMKKAKNKIEYLGKMCSYIIMINV